MEDVTTDEDGEDDEVIVRLTWEVTTTPSDNVITGEEDTRSRDVEAKVDDGDKVGVDCELEDWELEVLLLEMLVLLVDVGLELHDVENKVRVGLDVVNVTGTVRVTRTVFNVETAPLTVSVVAGHEELDIEAEQAMVLVIVVGGRVVTTAENDVERESDVVVTTWN